MHQEETIGPVTTKNSEQTQSRELPVVR
jgi:hypothetical protein